MPSPREIHCHHIEEANALLEEKGLGKLRHFHAAKAVNVPRGVNLGIQVQIDPLLLLNTGKYRALVDWKKKKSSEPALPRPSRK